MRKKLRIFSKCNVLGVQSSVRLSFCISPNHFENSVRISSTTLCFDVQEMKCLYREPCHWSYVSTFVAGHSLSLQTQYNSHIKAVYSVCYYCVLCFISFCCVVLCLRLNAQFFIACEQFQVYECVFVTSQINIFAHIVFATHTKCQTMR